MARETLGDSRSPGPRPTFRGRGLDSHEIKSTKKCFVTIRIPHPENLANLVNPASDSLTKYEIAYRM